MTAFGALSRFGRHSWLWGTSRCCVVVSGYIEESMGGGWVQDWRDVLHYLIEDAHCVGVVEAEFRAFVTRRGTGPSERGGTPRNPSLSDDVATLLV